MFNPTYSQQLQTSIEHAINDLIVQSKANTHSILERQAKIQGFKQDITTLEASSQVTDSEDSAETLEQARSNAVQQDCHTLATSIDTIGAHLSQKNTQQAVDLIEPFLKHGQLLKARVHYVYELEQLLNDFEQEKQVRSRLQKIASALDLSVDTLTQSTLATATPTEIISVTNSTSPEPEEAKIEVSTPTQTTEAAPIEPATLTDENAKASHDAESVATEQEPPMVPPLPERQQALINEALPPETEAHSVDLNHNSMLELEKLLSLEPPKSFDSPKPDFNKLSTTTMGSSAKHLDFMLQDTPDTFELDEDSLSGKALEDDLDSLLLEAELLEKQATFKKSLQNAETPVLNNKFSFK